MALAGADRIFRILDEKPELDEGYVTLVNAEVRMVRYGKHRNIQVTGHGNITTKRIIQQLISRWKVMWYLMVWILDMMRKRWFCMISSSLQNRVRRLHLLVLPEQEDHDHQSDQPFL